MADSQRKTALLNVKPLCGISTYKDTLNLATGVCTRQIKKIVFDGTENWQGADTTASKYLSNITDYKKVSGVTCMSTHYSGANNVLPGDPIPNNSACFYIDSDTNVIYLKGSEPITLANFKAYLAAQYAAGTPVTVWYILSAPTTETITVPSGLSGTEEGYLNQSGTPTPTNPIYPTANNVEVWLHSLRKLGTATDTITTLPADLYADGTNATVGLVGNMSQTGTPTPQNPITPQETGERTRNLFDATTLVDGYYIDSETGLPVEYDYQNRCATLTPIDVTNYDSVTLTYSSEITSVNFMYSTFNGDTFTGRAVGKTSGFTIDTTNTTKIYICFYKSGATITKDTLSSIMLNTGSTALPYQPYGYKLDIKSANTTTPVYLGEVESTRRIKKLVLDGTETGWNIASGVFYNEALSQDYLRAQGEVTILCSHYPAYRQVGGAGSVPSGSCSFYYKTDYQRLYINDSNYSTVADFTAYLAAQYAAGTPVCVWYVLATETTGVVNEPLRKIGTYTDTVSGITIPTIAGKDTFDVLTSLKPSEVSLTYTGWHDAEVKEWGGSVWQ